MSPRLAGALERAEEELRVQTEQHECQRCGSDEWTHIDYGGCSKCRSDEDRQAEDEEDAVARWVAWARTTSLRHGLTSFGGNRGS